MTIKQDILAALRGDEPERVPWNIHQSLLRQGAFEREMRNLGLGVVEKGVRPYQAIAPHVSVEERHAWEKGNRARYITYHTPLGDLHSKKVIGPDGSTWSDEYPVKGVDDLAVLEFITEDTVYYPNYDAVLDRQNTLGEDGIVVCRMMRSPLQCLLIEWMGIEGVVFGLADYREAMEHLLQCMATADEAALQIAVQSPAELVWSSENITASITNPRLFTRYCTPYYNHFASVLHSQGKLYGLHMDGQLAALKEAIANIHVDFIEAFTPPPMGDLELAEAKSAWPGKTIWVNFPGSEFHCSDDAVIQYTFDLLRIGMACGGFLLSFTEDLPETERSLRLVAEGVARHEKEYT